MYVCLLDTKTIQIRISMYLYLNNFFIAFHSCLHI